MQVLETRTDEVPVCIICQGINLNRHHYPPNVFNGKTFHYYRCGTCSSLSIHPIPDSTDLDSMYDDEERFDASDVEHFKQITDETSLPRYDYFRYQLAFLREDQRYAEGRKLLEYGCGAGSYLTFAQTLGFEGVGIEYNSHFASVMQKKYARAIFSYEEFEAKHKDKTFDVIHFGHVLEHLPDPREPILRLSKYAHAKTIFLFDGPVENNPCLSRFVIDLGSRIKRKDHNQYAPMHLSFSTYDSQLEFFSRLGFETLSYKVVEQPWPLSHQWSLRSPRSSALFLLSRASINLSRIVSRFGNVFHFCGRLVK